jgi:hypothetical protein
VFLLLLMDSEAIPLFGWWAGPARHQDKWAESEYNIA